MTQLLEQMDDLLTDLEELNVREIEVAPPAVRERTVLLVAEATGPAAAGPAPDTVMGLMDLVYDTLPTVLGRRRGLTVATAVDAGTGHGR